MKKRVLSVLVAICLAVLCVPQVALAEETKGHETRALDELYAESYSDALARKSLRVESEEDAYAYILAHIDRVTHRTDGTISFDTQALGLTENEKDAVFTFVEKLNKLVLLEAVKLDDKLQLHVETSPSDGSSSIVRKPATVESNANVMRMPVASIMTEARNHAELLKQVYDTSVLQPAELVAGVFFAERVKTGGIWDYKSYMGTHTVYYMEDLNTTMSGETIGNFHYGYVGRAVFTATLLKSAAGMYQIISGTSDLGYWDTFFDDPADQHDIDWGIRKYEAEH